MCQVQHVLHHDQGIGATGILIGKQGKGSGNVALHQQVIKIEDQSAVGQTQHVANLFGADLAGTVGNRLIQQ